MRDDAFTTKSGIVILFPTPATQWVMSGDDFYFDSLGRPSPVKVKNQINRGIYSENQNQIKDSFYASYCSYVLYLTQIMGFSNANYFLFYQTNSWSFVLINEERYQIFSSI